MLSFCVARISQALTELGAFALVGDADDELVQASMFLESALALVAVAVRAADDVLRCGRRAFPDGACAARSGRHDNARVEIGTRFVSTYLKRNG